MYNIWHQDKTGMIRHYRSYFHFPRRKSRTGPRSWGQARRNWRKAPCSSSPGHRADCPGEWPRNPDLAQRDSHNDFSSSFCGTWNTTCLMCVVSFFNAQDLLPPPHGLDPGLCVTWAGEAEVIVGHGVIVSLRGGQVHVINRQLLKQWDNGTLGKQVLRLSAPTWASSALLLFAGAWSWFVMKPMFDHMVASTVTWARLRARSVARAAHLDPMMMFTTLTQVLTMHSERPGLSRDHWWWPLIPGPGNGTPGAWSLERDASWRRKVAGHSNTGSGHLPACASIGSQPMQLSRDWSALTWRAGYYPGSTSALDIGRGGIIRFLTWGK